MRIAITVWLILISTLSLIEAQEPSKKDELVGKFAAMADSISTARVRRMPEPIQRNGDGFVFRQSKELHIEFQQGATRLDQDVNAEALFPLAVTGFTRHYDSRKQARPDTKRGSDLQRVKVTIQGLLAGEGKPKAKIRDFQLKQGTDYDAVQLARDEIIARIKWYLPEVEIEGRQKFQEKTLVINNLTDEPVWVFAAARTRQRTESGYEWVWKPANPASGEAHRVQVGPKSTKPFGIESEQSGSKPLQAARVRIWAESESGDRWVAYRSKDLWLVQPNAALDGDPVYHDTKMQSHTWRIEPKSGQRTFTERLVAFKNGTSEPLELKVRYLAREQADLRWRELPAMKIPPGTAAGPITPQGMRVYASQIRFVAKGTSLYFNKHADESLHLIEESEAGRMYSAEKIGQFVYVFEPKADAGAR